MYKFRELTLQALVKKYLRRHDNVKAFLSSMGLEYLAARPLEVLGELALSEGQVDAIIKEATPMGTDYKVAIEMKQKAASTGDLDQLASYVEMMGGECLGGALVAEKASAATMAHAKELGLHIFVYDVSPLDFTKDYRFDDILSAINVHPA